MTSSTIEHFNRQTEKTLDHLRRELQGIRTGRANPALIEELPVSAYGMMTPLLQLAAIQSPEPRLLVIQPWDTALLKDIERALSQSTLGISPVVDGKVIRLPFPPITEERRLELTKLVGVKAEEAKIQFRTAREETVKQLRTAEKAGTQSEDAVAIELKHLEQAMGQRLTTLEREVAKKTTELNTI